MAIGTLLGLGYATGMCLFFIYVREFWRVYTFQGNYIDMLLLSWGEEFFFDYFIASISFVVGFGMAVNYWAVIPGMQRSKRRRIWADAHTQTWYFIHIIFKVSFFYGVFLGSLSIFLYASVIDEHWFFFVVAPVVLFLHQWLRIRLYFRNGLRMMGITALSMVGYSTIISLLPIAEHSSLNESILKTSPYYYLDIKLPRSGIVDRFLRRSLTLEIYVGKLKTDTTKDAIFVDQGSPRELKLEEVAGYISEIRERYSENDHDQIEALLFIGNDVQTGFVNDLVFELRRIQIRRVRLMIESVQRTRGVPLTLPTLCTEEDLDPKGRPYPPCISRTIYMQSKKMVIELRDNEWYARGWKVNKDELITTIEHHVANNPEIPMELKVDAYSSYNSLFVIHESIYKVYAHLRKKAILKEFGVDYDSSAYFNEQIRFGQERLPMFLIYFSEEEQKLFEERKD